jgi:hypothetical protein
LFNFLGIKSMLPPPQDFFYNHPNRTLSWEEITGAVEYQIEYQDPQGIINPPIYCTVNHCPFDHPAGEYNVHGKTKDDGGWGIPGPWRKIIVGS